MSRFIQQLTMAALLAAAAAPLVAQSSPAARPAAPASQPTAASPDAGTDGYPDVGDGGASAADDGGTADTSDASTTDDAKTDADASGDAPPPDVPADTPSPDVPADGAAPDAPVDTPPADAPSDMTLAPDVSPDAPIPTTCTAVPPRAASSTTGGGSPSLAATPAGLFGLAWKGSSGNILFNSFTDSGGMQNASDATAVTAGTSLLGDPRLARIGSGELVLAYGVRTDTGSASAAAIKVNPQTGALIAGPTSGGSFSDTTPPIVGGVAVNPGQSQIGIASRRASTSARTQAELAVMGADLTTSGSVQPSALATTWTTAVAWATSAAKPNRFVVAAVSDNSATGGTLLDVAEANLQPGSNAPFTRVGDAPLAGGAGATVAAAGLGDAVAVVWVDDHSGIQEVYLAVIDLTSGNRRGVVQVSAGGTLPRQYPKVVFDGAALAVAWLEIQNGADSRIWLRRFDPTPPTPAPLGAALPIGSMGVATFGDIALAAAGAGKYGIAFSRTGSPGTKLFSYVECR